MAIQVNGNTVIDNNQNVTNVNSYSGDGIATQEEAEEGTNNDQLMTPLRVLDSIKMNAGAMIDKIQEDLGLIGPLPTEGAWEWNDNPGYTPGIVGSGGNISAAYGPLGIYLKSNYGSAIGNQLSSLISTISYDDQGSGSVASSSVGFESGPIVLKRQGLGSDYDNYAAFGGTLLSVFEWAEVDLGWKKVYNLNVNHPSVSDLGNGLPSTGNNGSPSNQSKLNFSRLESVNGIFGFNFLDKDLSDSARQGSYNRRVTYMFDVSVKFPELVTIDSIRPIFTWTRDTNFISPNGSDGSDFMSIGPCALNLGFPKLDIESFNKVILGIDGADLPSLTINITTQHSLSDLSPDARSHWNSLKSRFTTSGL